MLYPAMRLAATTVHRSMSSFSHSGARDTALEAARHAAVGERFPEVRERRRSYPVVMNC